MRELKVNIAVSGRFHYFNYVEYIYNSGLLNKFYYSHKVGSNPTGNMSSESFKNFWLKEYLVQGHARLFGGRFSAVCYPLYGSVWAEQVVRNWSPADILHIMAHSSALKVMRHARKDGSRLIAEVVNTHPENSLGILQREADKWGIRGPKTQLSSSQKRILDSVEMADIILAPTRIVEKSYTDRGIDPSRFRVVPYAANTARFFPDPKQTTGHVEPLRIICVGAIGLRKGQLYLLEAVKRLGRKSVDLTLVGTISEDIRHIVEGYAEFFKHIERIPNAELRDLLVQHDVFVLASHEEGLAVSICEAMAAGLAIVATRESGAEELFADGICGLLIESASSDAIVKALSIYMSDRELAREHGVNGTRATKARVNWRDYAARLISVYRE